MLAKNQRVINEAISEEQEVRDPVTASADGGGGGPYDWHSEWDVSRER